MPGSMPPPREKLLLELLPEAVFLISNRHTIEYANPEALRLLGYPQETELLHRPFPAIVEATSGDDADDGTAAVLLSQEREVNLVCRDGGKVPVRFSCRAIPDGEANGGFVGVARDLRPDKAMEQQLFQARQMAELGTLAAMIAHELRNPLGAIKMAAGNIRSLSADPAVEKRVASIIRRVGEADTIVNNLLHYTKAKQPDYARVHLASLLNEVVASAILKYPRHRLTIVRELAGIEGHSLDLDPVQIGEVFANVLANAIESFPERSGTLTLRGEHDPQTGFTTIVFQDDGAGIAPEKLPKVFDPFFSTKSKGTGLGLTICRQIVMAHGGTITVSRHPAGGTTCRIRLPDTIPNTARK